MTIAERNQFLENIAKLVGVTANPLEEAAETVHDSKVKT